MPLGHPQGFTLLTIFAIITIDWLDFGIVFPLLPTVARVFGMSVEGVALMPTGYAVAQTLSAPLWGRVSDRLGRKPVLLFAICGQVVASLLTASAGSFVLVVCARVLTGLTGGTSGVAKAFIADVVTDDRERSKYMAYAWGANSVGIMVGPIIGSTMLSFFGCYEAAFLAAAGLSGVNLLVCLCALKEPTPESGKQQEACAATGQKEEGTLAETLLDAEAPDPGAAAGRKSGFQGPPSSLPACAIYASRFLVDVGMAAFETVQGYYLMDTFFRGDALKSGQFFGRLFIGAGVVMVLSTVLYERVQGFMGNRGSLVLGIVTRSLGWLGMPLANSPGGFAVGFLMNAFGCSLIFPTQNAALAAVVVPESRGAAFGNVEASGAFAGIAGPTLAGWVYASFSHELVFFGVASLNVVAGLMIYTTLVRADIY